jgi:hypothetical protein
MNLKQRTSLSLLFVSLSSVPATAALTGDGESGGASIETTADRSTLQHLDQLLDGGNNAGLFDSVLQKHAGAAQAANSTMEGHYEGEGSDRPVQFGQQRPSDEGHSTATVSAPAQAPNLSLTAAVRLGTQQDSEPATVTSAGTPTSNPYVTSNAQATATTATNNFSTTIIPLPQTFHYTTTITPVAPVPLPAAGLLLASGLAGLTGLRRRGELESRAGNENGE